MLKLKDYFSRYNRIIIIGIILIFSIEDIRAQNTEHEHSESQHKHSIALVLSHTQINEGRDENDKKQWLSLPSWGINYNFSISNKWMIGLHTDIVIEDFVVESHTGSNEVIERSYPIASAIVGSYKLGSFNLMFGSGLEIADEDTFFLLRAGIEYALEINEKYELIANITNDYKFDAYNSWAIGIGVARRF